MNFKAAIAGMALLLATQADATLFKATWSGAQFENGATAVGIFDIDTSVYPLQDHDTTIYLPDATFKIISITVSGAESGNGVFDESSFESAVFFGFGSLDFSKELIGQIMSNDCAFGTTTEFCYDGASGDFNIFALGAETRGAPAFDAPIGSYYFVLGADQGVGDQMYLTSLRSAVPEPASWALMLTGFGLAGGALRRQRALSAV